MSATAVRRRRLLPELGRGRRIRVRPRLLLAVVLLAAVLFGAYLWVRQSSLVAVRKVTVTGVSGASAGPVRRALIAEAKTMTTMDVKTGKLRAAVAAFPVVKDIRVSTQFPHGLTIRVEEEIPVAVVTSGGTTTPVAGDGTLLRNAADSRRLPAIALPAAPGGTRLTGPAIRAELAVLAAAPYQFLPHIRTATSRPADGVVLTLRDGPSLYFGDRQQLAAKWRAAVNALADTGTQGAVYVDVSDPARPAAGGGTPAAELAAQSASAYGAVSGLTSTDATSTDAGPVATTTDPAISTATAPTETAPAATATAPAVTATAPAETPTTPTDTPTTTTG